MKNYFRQYAEIFRNDRVFRLFLRAALILFALCFFILVWRFNRLPPQLPLYYSLPWGEDQLASPIELVIFSSSLILFWGVQVFGAFILYRKYTYLARLLLVGSILITVLGLYSAMRILFLVT